MFIAFEGPDNVGKSTTAAQLATTGKANYNAVKSLHKEFVEAGIGKDHNWITTYDRIDWFSHMVYRLALPDRDWNDDRPRTVFAMPETHLVVMLHKPEEADFTADEVVDTPIKDVNQAYYLGAMFLATLSHAQDNNLFRSISLVEVSHEGGYSAVLKDHFSAIWDGREVPPVLGANDLLDFLREQDRQF